MARNAPIDTCKIPKRVLQTKAGIQPHMHAYKLSNKTRFLKNGRFKGPRSSWNARAKKKEANHKPTISICLMNNKRTGPVPTGVQLDYIYRKAEESACRLSTLYVWCYGAVEEAGGWRLVSCKALLLLAECTEIQKKRNKTHITFSCKFWETCWWNLVTVHTLN